MTKTLSPTLWVDRRPPHDRKSRYTHSQLSNRENEAKTLWRVLLCVLRRLKKEEGEEGEMGC